MAADAKGGSGSTAHGHANDTADHVAVHIGAADADSQLGVQHGDDANTDDVRRAQPQAAERAAEKVHDDAEVAECGERLGAAGGWRADASDGSSSGSGTDGSRECRQGKKQLLEDWSRQHVADYYHASLAPQKNVSRALWSEYTDPERQRRRRRRGKQSSVVVGTVGRIIAPADDPHRKHKHGYKHYFCRCCGRVMYPTAMLPILVRLIVGIWDCTYSAFLLPITTVFRVPVYGWTWVTILDLIAAVIFSVDMVVTFCTGIVIVNNLRQALVMDKKIVAKHYILHSTFVIDLLATTALWASVMLVAVSPHNRPDHAGVTVIRALRCFRLLRLLHILQAAIKQSFLPTTVRWLPHNLGYFLNLTYTAALILNLLGCVWYLVARIEQGKHEANWLQTAGGSDLTYSSEWVKYVASVYWATETITTVGYGDITPVSTVERIMCVGVMLLGVLFFGFIIGAISESLENASANAQRGKLFRGKMEGVDRWMEARNLPRHLRSEITAYYSDVWTRHTAYNDNDFFEDLPAALRGKVARYRIRPCIANSELGQALGPLALLVLSTVVKPTALQPGHDLCQQGTAADRLWFLTEGSMLAIAHGRSMARITAPAVLGESAVLAAMAGADAKRPLTYRAASSSSLWELTVDDVMRMRSLQPGLLDHLATNFAQQAEKSLKAMDPRQWRQLFPDAVTPEDIIARLRQELRNAEDSQHDKSAAAEVIAALGVDMEPLGGRRDLVLPTLEKISALLEVLQNESGHTHSLRTFGHSVPSAEVSSRLGLSPRGSEGGPNSEQTSSTADALNPLDPRSGASHDPERESMAEATAWKWHAAAAAVVAPQPLKSAMRATEKPSPAEQH